MRHEFEEWDLAHEIRLIEDALSKIHNAGIGTFDWFQVVDWTVKGILEERLRAKRDELNAASPEQLDQTRPVLAP